MSRALTFLAFAVATILTACTAGPGAPLHRTGTDDGYGPMIAGCTNVSPADPTETFATGSYLTTWGSVWQEGIVTPEPPTFCRAYPAPAPDVLQVASDMFNDVLRPLGYQISVDVSQGELQTGYLQQEHQMALWRDRYVVKVRPIDDHRAEMRVQREVLIAQKIDPKREYNAGVSVGKNETWILNETGRRLSENR